MAQYTKNPEAVEAVQWNADGDHDDIEALTVTAKQAVTICTSCGQPMRSHGMRVLADGLHDTICPGWWIITGDDGRIEYVKDDAKFKKRYAVAKEATDG